MATPIRGSVFAAAALAAFSYAAPSRAEDCALPVHSEGRVVDVRDGRTVRFDDGREVRLAGLAPSTTAEAAARTRSALADLVQDRDVVVQSEDGAPDRYGRERALLVVANTTVQETLLARGLALSDLSLRNAACIGRFLRAEAQAHAAHAGLWGDAGVIKNAESVDDIAAQVGMFSLVEGRVRSVRTLGAATYVNMSRRWTTGFAVVISKRALPAFMAAGLNPAGFVNRTLRVRGHLERRLGPRIEAVRPEQIEFADSATDSARASD